jgi:DNA polymerase III subunit chi
MTDVWFYHLERQPLEIVLPRILAGMHARGDRICVHGADQRQLEDLSLRLWKVEDTAFVPNGFDAADHQVLFTAGTEALNSADYRIFVDCDVPQDLTQIKRAAIFFDGTSETKVEQARELWKRMRTDGHTVKYWKQSDSGRWEDQAQKRAA